MTDCLHADERFEGAPLSFDPEHPDLGWTIAEPEPFYAPPRFRSIVWAWLLRRPSPDWRPVKTDPNPTESRFRRG